MIALWPQALCVALGSALGGVLRWIVGLGLNGLPTWFPLGTLAVNAGGGFAIGLAGAWFAHRPDELLRLLLVTGLLGGFTTFSAFSGESLNLLQRGAYAPALLHAAAHVLGGLACAALGASLGHAAWSVR